MSSDETYGGESYGGRGGRRAGHASREPSRASAGAAAAILILAAIFGFGGGALMANAGGDDEEPAAEVEEDAPSEAEPTEDEQPDDEPTEEASDGAATLTSPLDGGSTRPGERIDYTLQLDPPAAGVSLTFERSFDGGDNWETFLDVNGDPITTPETRDDGVVNAHIITSREGEIYFRLVGQSPDGWVESNPIVVALG